LVFENSEKIIFAGDPHGEFRPLISAVKKHRPVAVILLGDMDLLEPLEVCLAEVADLAEIYWIPGNHDYDRQEYYDNLFNSDLSKNNLDGKVVEIAGLKIAGLGGVFKGKVWHPDIGVKWSRREDLLHFLPSNVSKGGIRRHHECAIWPEDYERLAGLKADILVSHEAPSCHRYGFEELDLLAEMMGVKRIFHGHHHTYYMAHLESGVRVCGAPIQRVVDLNGSLVVGDKNGC
jgi:predicted phosphodiesterase